MMDPDELEEFLDEFPDGDEPGQRRFPFMGGHNPFGFPFDVGDEEDVQSPYSDEEDDFEAGGGENEEEDEDEDDDDEIRSDRIDASPDGTLRFTGTQYGDVGVYQAKGRPFSSEFAYYEVKILEWGECGRIGVGLAHARYSLRRQPGWDSNSIAYHCDDGRLYQATGFGRRFAAPAEVGDVIGCGIDYAAPSPGPRRVRVFFTRNGTELGSASVHAPPGGFYPTVGLHSAGESVRVDLSAAWPPEHDDDEMIGRDRFADPIEKWTRLSRVIRKDGLLCYTGLGQSDSDGGLALSASPVTPYNHYFELEIVDSGDKGYVAIGIARLDYPKYRHPGWSKGSVAYHADDGKLFHGEGIGQVFGPSCHQGDRMGCGVKFLDDDEEEEEEEDDDDDDDILDAREGQRVEVYFTRNGKKVGQTVAKVPDGGFYPIIGMLSRGEKVRPDLHAITG